MLALSLSGLLLAFLMVFMGHAAKSALKLEGNVWDSVFLGMAVLNTLCAWVSLVIPVGIHLFAVLTFVTLLIAIPRIRRIRAVWRESGLEPGFLALLAVVCTAAWLIASDFPRNSDTPLYHLQTIKWYEQYPVVPGLGNLHGRLAFNQNVFLLFSLSSLKDVFGQEIFSVNLVVFVIFTSYILTRIRDVHAVYGYKPVWFAYLLLAVFFIRVPNLSSPSPDYLSQVLSLYIFARFMDMSLEEDESGYRSVPILLLLGIYSFTIKLSAAPMPLLVLVLFLMGKGPGIGSYLRLLPAILLIVVPWLARNVIMTGWLLYPFPSLDLFSFDWKIPFSEVVMEKVAVTGWARISGEENYVKAFHMPLSEWFPVWFRGIFKKSLFEAFLILLGFLAPVVGLIGMLMGWIRRTPLLVAVMVTCAAGMLSWFWLGPNFRFGVGVISISVISLLLFLSPLPKAGLYVRKGIKPLPWAVVLMTVFLLFRNAHSLGVGEYAKPIGPDRLYKPRLLKIENQSFEMRKAVNFEYSLPALYQYCYDRALPCANLPDSTIALRGEGLRNGFRKAVD
jgi:hypothetical protein